MQDGGLSITQSTLKHRLEDIPQSVLGHIQMGVALLQSLSDEQRNAIVSYVLKNFSRRGSYDLDEAAQLSGVQRSLAPDLLSTITLVVGSIFDLETSKDDFFRFAPEPFQSPGAKSLIDALLDQTIGERDRLKKEVESAKLANAVLPSFRQAHCAVDIRVKFDEEDNIVAQVPICVVYIATDSDTSELWFQAAEEDLDTLIEKLSQTKRQLKMAVEKAR